MNDAAPSWTEREIAQQPDVWLLVTEIFRKAQPQLQPLLAPLLADPALRIVLTGAGTSSFIGTCLSPVLAARLQRRVDAVATTDLVTGPQFNLQRHTSTLLVSFARSGNSPESVAAVELANRMLDRVAHLIITCNAEGALARLAAALGKGAVLVLPEATNDRGFAMTSSFSSMLLMAALVFGAVSPDAVPRLTGACAAAMPRIDECVRRLVARRFERVVFLGSNALRGLAAEAALKVLELTDGRLLAMSESVLGFRHGPKTVINDRTLVVVFCSEDAHTRAYDHDLLDELRRDARAGALLAVGAEHGGPDGVERLDLAGVAGASDLEMALLDVVFAQTLAFRQSQALGLSPDRPNASGVVNRVVQGVTIHPWPEDRADVPRR